MKAKVLLLLILAGGVGYGAMLFARQWLADQEAQIAREAPAAPEAAASLVLVARNDMAAGQFVRESDLRWQEWPEAGVHDAYIVAGERPLDILVGAVVRQRLGAGEPVTDSRIVLPGDRGFLAAVLQPGQRAVAVPIDADRGIAGLVFPGDRVDVLLTHVVDRPAGFGTQEVRATETVLSDIRVLAIDQNTDDRSEEPKVADTVTLEVTPRQAEEIRVILSLGSLSLSLRSLGDPAAEAAPAAEGGIVQVAGVVAPGSPDKAMPKPLLSQTEIEGFTGWQRNWHTYTLDSDVSMLLRQVLPSVPPPPEPAAAAPLMPAPAPTVTVFRGSAVR